ncbi:tRNA methyltransferase [Candidatus Poribacteria bacterium]|nr:tRNA methyltransferase [Candidatus Poribacteria bacterium]
MKQLRAKPLKDFLKQVEHPEMELIFILQDVEDPANVGAAFRIADACRVREMILTGISARPPHPLIKKVGRGKDRRVKWTYTEQAADAIEALKEHGYTSCALEITAQSVPYYEAQYPDKLCLIVGHEDHGVTKRTLAVCDMMIYIPMYGKGASLNVHVSLGIAAYHILHSRRNLQSSTSPPTPSPQACGEGAGGEA